MKHSTRAAAQLGELTKNITKGQGEMALDFKEAFDMIMGIHEECGDRQGWLNQREQLNDDVKHYKSFNHWQENLNRRTNISDDKKWDMECFSGSIAILFLLMGLK